MLRGVVCMLSTVASAQSCFASVIVHDNSDGGFVLGANLNFFDVTRAAADQALGSADRGIFYLGASGGGSNTPQGDLISGGSGVRTARNPILFDIRVQPNNTLFQLALAQAFNVDELIGPDEVYAGRNVMALFHIAGGAVHAPLVGQSPFTGFSLQLADGIHYGWIHWSFSTGPIAEGGTIPMYQPIRWAYETEPNVPIVVPGPGAAAVLALAGLIASRRRRSR